MFYELTTQELFSVEGGDFFDFVEGVCKFVIVNSCSAIGGAIGFAAGTAATGGNVVVGGCCAVVGGGAGSWVGTKICSLIF